MIDGTLLIAIITKNVDKYISDVLKNAETYSKFFNDYKAVIVDGNSVDDTVKICNEWCSREPNKRTFLTQYNSNLARPLLLEQARNMYIDHFSSYFGDNVYLMCLDADDINATPLSVESFLSNFKYTDWDAMFANQSELYYDVWTLRNADCDYDCWERARQTQDMSWVNRLHKHIDKNGPLIKCESAFGGTAIYNTRLLKGIRYRAFMGGKECCEHVPFNMELHSRGGKLFINPMFINK